MRISKRVKFMWAVLAALASVTSAALVGATCCAPDPSDVFCPDSCTADRFSEDVYLCYECTEDEGDPGDIVQWCCWYHWRRYKCNPNPGYSFCHPPYYRDFIRSQKLPWRDCPPAGQEEDGCISI